MEILEFIIVDCEKAEIICTKKQYKDAGYIDLLRLKTHLFFCKKCQCVSRRNNRLTSLLQSVKIEFCQEDVKAKLRRRISKIYSNMNIERTT